MTILGNDEGITEISFNLSTIPVQFGICEYLLFVHEWWLSNVFTNLLSFLLRMPTFGEVCFLELFYLRPPYKCFKIFEILEGPFWVQSWVFENFEILFGDRVLTLALAETFDLKPTYAFFGMF